MNKRTIFRQGNSLFVVFRDVAIELGWYNSPVIPYDIMKLTGEEFEEYKKINEDLYEYADVLYFVKIRGGVVNKSVARGNSKSYDFRSDILQKILTLGWYKDAIEKEEIEEALKLGHYLQSETDTPEEPKASYVYLMRDENTGYTKIGCSKEPDKREKTLQSEKPTITLLHAWKGTVKEEKELHSQFSSKRVRGEWFDLDEFEIWLIKSQFGGREVYGK